MGYKILIADDEKEVIELLRLYLEKDGHTVLACFDGMSALGIISSTQIDIALLDVMMPELNGFQLLKKIREKSNIPVLMLSAKTSSADKILGLDLGADDYITKPFDPLEVVARIKSNIRRYKADKNAAEIEEETISECGDIVLNTQKCTILDKSKGIETELTSIEYKILHLFFSSPNRVFTKNQLIRAGWGENIFVEDNSIMVALSKLRAKLGESVVIKNIRGLGYRLEAKKDGKKERERENV